MQLALYDPSHLANVIFFIAATYESWIQTVLREPTYNFAHKAVQLWANLVPWATCLQRDSRQEHVQLGPK